MKGLLHGREEQQQEAGRAEVERREQALVTRNRLDPQKSRLAERRIERRDCPIGKRVPGVFERAHARQFGKNFVRIDMGPLDAALPLITVHVVRELRLARQETQAENHRARENGDKGRAAELKSLDKVDADKVE